MTEKFISTYNLSLFERCLSTKYKGIYNFLFVVNDVVVILFSLANVTLV